MDNLESETYEGFERDPVKYRQYEEVGFRVFVIRNLLDQSIVACRGGPDSLIRLGLVRSGGRRFTKRFVIDLRIAFRESPCPATCDTRC